MGLTLPAVYGIIFKACVLHFQASGLANGKAHLLRMEYPGVAQLVARLLWEQDAAGSNPVTRTISSVHNGFELWTLDFSIFSYVEQAVACSCVMPSGGL